MSAFKGTPGPWAVRVEEQHYVTSAEGRIANVLFPRYSADGAEVMANDRLIAAAPDLLDTVEELLLEIDRSMPHCTDAMQRIPSDSLRRARAAIAKAVGP